MQQIAATDVPMKNSCHFMYLRMFVNHADDGVIDRSVLKTDTRIPEIPRPLPVRRLRRRNRILEGGSEGRAPEGGARRSEAPSDALERAGRGAELAQVERLNDHGPGHNAGI